MVYRRTQGWVRLGCELRSCRNLRFAQVADKIQNIAKTCINAAPAASDAPSGVAKSAAQAARLRQQLASQEIAGGHALSKHAGDFADVGITARGQFARHIENIMNNPSAFRELRNGRSAFWDDATGTVVIRNRSDFDGGTAFRPTTGRAYFEGLR